MTTTYTFNHNGITWQKSFDNDDAALDYAGGATDTAEQVVVSRDGYYHSAQHDKWVRSFDSIIDVITALFNRGDLPYGQAAQSKSLCLCGMAGIVAAGLRRDFGLITVDQFGHVAPTSEARFYWLPIQANL